MTTITEALAEIKTLEKRIYSKRNFISTYIVRQDGMKDPLEKDGGSASLIERELQAVNDLETRWLYLRMGIQKANENNTISLEGTERTIAEWLVWRREVAPVRKEFLNTLKRTIVNARDQAKRQGVNILSVNQTAEKLSDYIVNLSEHDLTREWEKMEKTLGDLDGQLSLKNATCAI